MTDPARYAVNEYAPDPSVVFDRKIGETYVRSAHMLAARGYVQSTLGGMVIRVEHPKHPDGRVLHGARATSVGHQMNREILRLWPDVGCVIHPTFIQDTNCLVMKRHGITVLGRTVSECYHRVTTYASEVKRQILVELLCAAKGTKPEAMSEDEMRWMFEHGDDIVYPAFVRKDATRPRGRKASRIRAR
jgi:ribulose-5-phosphate 4-epimerase/fuculose-1-phosphate aldolase